MRVHFVLFFLLCSASALGFGISQDYHENSTIVIPASTSYVQNVTVQNDLDEPLLVNFSVNSEYAGVAGGKAALITLPANSIGTVVPITVTVPSNLVPGTAFSVGFTAQPIINGTGTVTMAVRLHDSFTVRVAGIPPKKPVLLYTFISLVCAFTLLFLGTYGYRKLRSYLMHRVPRGALQLHGNHITSVAQLREATLRMSDAQFSRSILARKEEIAQWVFKKARNPEQYHKLKLARTKAEFVRRLA